MKYLKSTKLTLQLIVLSIPTLLLISAGIEGKKSYQPTSSNFSKGLQLEQEGNFIKAEGCYNKLIKNSDNLSAELLFHIGSCQLNRTCADSAIGTLNQAESFLEIRDLSSDLSIDIYLLLGKAYQLVLEPSKAITIYNRLLSIIKESDGELKKEIEEEIRYSQNAQTNMKNPWPCIIKNLGGEINSSANDHSPILSKDESEIYYTSRKKNNIEGELIDGSSPEKIYHSTISSDSWSKNDASDLFFKNFVNESAVSLSADGTELFLFRNDRDGQSLYESEYKDKKWGKPFKLPEPINSQANETSATLSPDKSTLFFTSDRPGGFGEKDIYLVRRQKDGAWGSVTNLGTIINTPLDEETPLIHYDGKTLYFASEGHNSMGGLDIFYSQMNPDSSWQEPTTLGYPINSPDDDFFFSPSISNDHAYFASSRQADSYGGCDIYKVDYKKFINGDLALIAGNLPPKDSMNFQNKKNELKANHKDSNIAQANYRPNTDGKYMLILETEKQYAVTQKEEALEETKTHSNEPLELAYQPTQKLASFASLETGIVWPNASSDPSKINNTATSTKSNSVEKVNIPLAPYSITKKQDNERETIIPSSNENQITYTIQLLALKRHTKPYKDFFVNLSEYKIKLHRCIDGYTRFTVGSFSSIAEAQLTLGKIQKKGGLHQDAYIRNAQHKGENHIH